MKITSIKKSRKNKIKLNNNVKCNNNSEKKISSYNLNNSEKRISSKVTNSLKVFKKVKHYSRNNCKCSSMKEIINNEINEQMAYSLSLLLSGLLKNSTEESSTEDILHENKFIDENKRCNCFKNDCLECLFNKIAINGNNLSNERYIRHEIHKDGSVVILKPVLSTSFQHFLSEMSTESDKIANENYFRSHLNEITYHSDCFYDDCQCPYNYRFNNFKDRLINHISLTKKYNIPSFE